MNSNPYSFLIRRSIRLQWDSLIIGFPNLYGGNFIKNIALHLFFAIDSKVDDGFEEFIQERGFVDYQAVTSTNPLTY